MSQSEEQAAKKRARKPKLAAIFAEETIMEDLEEYRESPHTDHDEKSETGYFSQGSDLVSTPKELSNDEFSKSTDKLDTNDSQVLECMTEVSRVLDPSSAPCNSVKETLSRTLSCSSEPNLTECTDSLEIHPASRSASLTEVSDQALSKDRISAPSISSDDGMAGTPSTSTLNDTEFDSGYENPLSPSSVSLPTTPTPTAEPVTPLNEEPPSPVPEKKKKTPKPVCYAHYFIIH